MFFVASKVVWFLLQPSSLLWLTLAAGVALSIKWPAGRTGRRLLVVGVVGLLVCGISPLANVLLAPLENRFPALQPGEVTAPVTGIILLGGGEESFVSEGRPGLALNEAGDRITEAARLAVRFPQAKLVLTGGSGRLIAEASAMPDVAQLLVDLGISRQRLIVESASRDTYENAALSLPLMTPRPGEHWLLVTSAHHMPRAVGAFRRLGLDVIAYPVDFRTRGTGDMTRLFPSIAAGLMRLDLAVKEWLGLIAYRLSGRSSALFPAP